MIDRVNVARGGQFAVNNVIEMGDNLDNLRALDDIEKDLCTALQSAGQAIQELGKDKSSMKQVENHTNAFLKSLQAVETAINQQILNLNQVSTGQAHEGSTYASQKTLNMARHRHEHVKSKLAELDRLKQTYLVEQSSSSSSS